jgi:hypothetical protein
MATVLVGILPKSSVLLCVFFFFLWKKELNARDIHEEMFSACGGKCLSRKAGHNWIEKFSQGRSKVVGVDRPGRPVENATEASVQRVDELIQADMRITIDSVAIALGCFMV